MEFLLIGDSKLKIVLTEDDMITYKLNGCGEPSSASYRRAFWRVLDLAKEEVGFDPDGDKVLIQFYPLKSGGCEVFVTKLGILSKESAKMVAKSDKVTMLSKKKCIYAFDSKEDLTNFFEAIKVHLIQPYPEADVYKTRSARYYLSVEEFSLNEGAEMPLLFEYAKPLNPDLEYFVTEHLEKLNKGNAIEEFHRLF